PPVVDFLQPRENIAVDSATLKVRFRVRSASALSKVQLLQEDGKPAAVDLSRLQPQQDGSYQSTTEMDIQLRRGLTVLRVVAANAGGEQDAALVVNFPYRPVRLVIDSLLPIGPGGKAVPAAAIPGGTLVFPEMPHGRVQLRGHLVWDEQDDARLQQTKIVRVLVNGFQQLPAQLEPAAGGSRERAFRTDLLLSQAANNRVEIALPGLEQDASNRTEFLVNCKDPARAQRLHLILVSLNEEDAKGLDSKFLKLLEPAFEGVDVYGPQVGYRAGRAYVLQQLQKV